MIDVINPLAISLIKYLHDALSFNHGLDSLKLKSEQIEDLVNINRFLDDKDNIQCPLKNSINKELLLLSSSSSTKIDEIEFKAPKKRLNFKSNASVEKLEYEKLIDMVIWDKPLNQAIVKPNTVKISNLSNTSNLLNKLENLENNNNKQNQNRRNNYDNNENNDEENGSGRNNSNNNFFNGKRKYEQTKLE